VVTIVDGQPEVVEAACGQSHRGGVAGDEPAHRCRVGVEAHPLDAMLRWGLASVDYAGHGDRDWVQGHFIRHGVRPRDVGVPEIRRLTSSRWDYKKLLAGLSALDFRSGNELADDRRPLYDPVNLYRSDVRVAVVKKNKTATEATTTGIRTASEVVTWAVGLMLSTSRPMPSQNSSASELRRTRPSRRSSSPLRSSSGSRSGGFCTGSPIPIYQPLLGPTTPHLPPDANLLPSRTEDL